jgi:hypothetical protein
MAVLPVISCTPLSQPHIPHTAQTGTNDTVTSQQQQQQQQQQSPVQGGVVSDLL